METRLHYRPRLEALNSFSHLTLPLVPLTASSYEGSSPAPVRSDLKMARMTPIPAKVVNVCTLDCQHLVTVWVGSEIYQGTFDRLDFGENKPHLGWYHFGWLELAYHQNPALSVGQSFPLWALQ